MSEFTLVIILRNPITQKAKFAWEWDDHCDILATQAGGDLSSTRHDAIMLCAWENVQGADRDGAGYELLYTNVCARLQKTGINSRISMHMLRHMQTRALNHLSDKSQYASVIWDHFAPAGSFSALS